MIFGLVALSGQLATATESIWQRKSALLLLVISDYTSIPPISQCPKPPDPPAWMIQPPSD
ncbi:hypothetical protein KC222_19110 [Cedecea davisae]|uniref:Uncharacterized protein n=1 Tax=Cedecea davisae TaxID=158484 RepID=A0ABS6DLP0_9ENTR|nr:hypothetical protein [Cedecea davisae]MBU4689042.1 hypothetical protein [Cedecea davisae]